MRAPFKPVIRDELDVSNFADEFTEMDPTYSPAALPQNCDRIFQVGGRWRMLHSQTAFLLWLMFLLFTGRNIPLCSLQVIAQDGISICMCFVLMFVWALVAGSVKCWHGWKIALYIMRFCLRLYLTYSTAIEVIKWSFECPQKVAVSQHESVCVHWYSNWLKSLLLK